jgi:hypothetical protein
MSDVLRAVNPTYHAYCGTCRKVRLHAGVCDEHGCERGSQCDICKTINRPIACSFAARQAQRKKAS